MHAPSYLRAVLLLATMSSGLFAQSTRDEQREGPEVRGLILKGVKHVDVQELLKSISTQSSKCRSLLIKPFCLVSHSPTFEDKHYLNRDQFRRDVLRIRLIYWKHGYRDAQVDTTVQRIAAKQVRVTFDVHENEPTIIRKLTLTGDVTTLAGVKGTSGTTDGTGTAAKLACLAADGKLAEGDAWVQESIIGSRFTGRYTREGDKIIPTITGNAWVNAETTLLLDDNDPFVWGIR
jgi:hypothetical protein